MTALKRGDIVEERERGPWNSGKGLYVVAEINSCTLYLVVIVRPEQNWWCSNEDGRIPFSRNTNSGDIFVKVGEVPLASE